MKSVGAPVFVDFNTKVSTGHRRENQEESGLVLLHVDIFIDFYLMCWRYF